MLGTFIGAAAALLLWIGLRRRRAGQTADKQPFAPYVLVGFLLTSACLQ